MVDDKIVQTGESSEEGEASTEGAEQKQVEQPPQPQPLTEERIKQIVAEAATKATETARREIQSIKDKARREVEDAQARAGFAEDALANLGQETDPQTAELVKLRAKDSYRTKMDAVTTQRQQAEVFDKNFQENMAQFVTQMGIDPNDKRIDWGVDARDYLSKQQRILASVGQIQQEAQKSLQDTLTKQQEQRQKDFEAKIRKDLGLDTEETGVSPGIGGTDADFIKKFGEGELPYTKENVDRANKLMSK